MTVFSELREELADMLTAAGLRTTDHIPARITPPLVIVAAGQPYVQEVFDTKTFAHDYKVNMRLTLVMGTATNAVVTDALDAAIEATLVALQGAWEADVTQPYLLETGNGVYLATDVNITTSITIA